MASTDRSELPPRQWKLLAMTSGNRCAFPKCGRFLAIPGDDGAGDVITGVAAHIVAASRQGPRGDFDLSEEDRDRSARNRILLCPEHHILIDSRPTVFTVQVLRQMKADHERQFLPPEEQGLAPKPVAETLLASFLPITNVPSVVMTAPLRVKGLSEGEAAKLIRWPSDRNVLLPYIVRDNRLHTFSDLSRATHPFIDVVAPGYEILDARALWSDPEGHRRYVALLNKSMTKYLGRDGIRYDRDHHRYWFTAAPGPRKRSVSYHTKQGRPCHRDVVRQRVRKATGEAKEWWHVAAGIRFERVAHESWVLAIRPEFQITHDGLSPLPPKTHGARSTRKKSKLYNEDYLNLLHFWREYLIGDGPRLTIRAADQRIVIAGDLCEAAVSWPGVQNDLRSYAPRVIQDNLFTAFELAEATETVDLERYWDDDDDEEGAA